MSGRAVLATVLAAIPAVSCGGAEPAAEQTPEYTRPAYATRERQDGQTRLRFTDITLAAGIDFVHETGAFGEKWMPETMGSGAAFLDYDVDGWPDVLLVNGSQWPGHESGDRATARLYRNMGGGQFRDVTRSAGLDFSVYGMGISVADYDGDGDPDIYLTAVGDNRLLRNDAGRFTDVTRAAGVTGNGGDPAEPPSWSTASAWLDFDRDGWLDLFVCNYVRWTPETDLYTTLDGKTKSYATPEQYDGETCRLYRNERGRSFSDVTEGAGILNRNGKTLGLGVEDIDDDGWPDVVVANDTYQNFLYRNNGDATFTDIALSAGVAFDEFGRARAGMGIDIADVTNQGRLSIVIGNFSNEAVSLYTQIDAELFQDLAGSARLTRVTLLPLTFGVLFADLDLDGFLDLVLGNGHIEPDINSVLQDVTFQQRPLLLRNNGRGQFVDVSQKVGDGFDEPTVARGVAVADMDRDGDLDLLLTVNGGRPRLLRNDLPGEDVHWLKLSLRGSSPNRDAVGAVVHVFAGDVVQRRLVRTGSSYLSQSETRPLTVGLGAHDTADSVVVRWPTSGLVQKLVGVRAGQTIDLVEGDRR